jgi:hypothetical protein
VRSSLYRRRYGFGHLFGLFFLVRHPAFLLVIAVIAFAVYLYRSRR